MEVGDISVKDCIPCEMFYYVPFKLCKYTYRRNEICRPVRRLISVYRLGSSVGNHQLMGCDSDNSMSKPEK
jgi:hypothetical protein